MQLRRTRIHMRPQNLSRIRHHHQDKVHTYQSQDHHNKNARNALLNSYTMAKTWARSNRSSSTSRSVRHRLLTSRKRISRCRNNIHLTNIILRICKTRGITNHSAPRHIRDSGTRIGSADCQKPGDGKGSCEGGVDGCIDEVEPGKSEILKGRSFADMWHEEGEEGERANAVDIH